LDALVEQESVGDTQDVATGISALGPYDVHAGTNREYPAASEHCPELVDASAAAVLTGLGLDENRTPLYSDALTEQEILRDREPQEPTTRADREAQELTTRASALSICVSVLGLAGSALGLFDVPASTERDCAPASEQRPEQGVAVTVPDSAPAESNVSPVELDTEDARPSKVKCHECSIAVEVFYWCIPCGIRAMSWGLVPPAVCPACQEASKSCNEHGKVLVRGEQFGIGQHSLFRLYINPKEEFGDSPLVKAVKRRDLARLESLTAASSSFSASDPDKYASLHVACSLGHVAEARCLLKYGAHVEARNTLSQTPLVTAIIAGRFAVVPLLIERGANKSAVDGLGKTPLQHACRIGLLAAVVGLLAATPSDQLLTYVNHSPAQSATPLMYACRSGDVAIAAKLLEAGAEPNFTGFVNGTSYPGTFQLPSSASGLKLLNLLASFGANLFGGDARGWNHLHVNAWRGRADLCYELLHIGANGPKLENVQVTLITPSWPPGTFRLNINSQTKEGYTALFLAARNDHRDIVQRLMESGADASLKCPLDNSAGAYDGEMFTPLAAAVCFGHAKTASCLVNSGARLDETSAGVTPLCIAAQRGSLEMASRLIDAGANVNFMKQKEDSVLSIAARNGHVRVVELLLKNGAYNWPPSAGLLKKRRALRFERDVSDAARENIASYLHQYLGHKF
jgi:ankyrin repeat protein